MDALVAEFPRFVEGFFGTLRISVIAAVFALVLGTLLAAFRVSPVPPLRWIGTAWVTVFRNPWGLPKAKTVWPCRRFRYPASGRADSFTPSIFRSARSFSRATPTIRAGTTSVLADSAFANDPSVFGVGRII